MPTLTSSAVAVQYAVLISAASIALPLDAPNTFTSNNQVLLQNRAKLHAGSAPELVGSWELLAGAARDLMPQQGAAWSMSKGPWSVVNKTIALPAGVSIHDYLSIGIYNHPCNNLPLKCKAYPGGHLLPPSECDNTTGLPWEPCDGIRNYPAINEGDAPSAGDMAHAVETLALAAFFCAPPVKQAECDTWARRAVLHLRVFFLINDTKMNPNLYYGQIDPRQEAPSKGHGGFIEWTTAPVLLDRIELLAFAAPQIWTDSDQKSFHEWLVSFLDYVESPEASGERDMTNNHGTWFDNTWQGVALHSNRMDNATTAAKEVLHRRIDTQIKSDGKEWIELERANPSGYCQYNLAALVNNAVQSSNSNSEDIWNYVSPTGGSIRKVVDWLLPYATKKAVWPYKENTEEPNWASMFPVLRQASIAYRNESYEQAACLVAKSFQTSSNLPSSMTSWPLAPQIIDYAKDEINLLAPPVYKVQC